ncbi:hypothetical protein CEXT_637991 [Caerostris extrusa]|uniref:Uncharacterized protein n=1 Tax=Caerostris extrusa TaxID=172846 RepID=A0AAV4TP26_CAEEX|nr:hypothetical protein CEXT_637991 [Caerostris extrusa]
MNPFAQNILAVSQTILNNLNPSLGLMLFCPSPFILTILSSVMPKIHWGVNLKIRTVQDDGWNTNGDWILITETEDHYVYFN